MQSSAVFLHDHTGDNILVGFLQFGQHTEAGFHHRPGPVVHLVMLVRVASDGRFDRFLDNFAHIIHDELMLFPSVIHTVDYDNFLSGSAGPNQELVESPEMGSDSLHTRP